MGKYKLKQPSPKMSVSLPSRNAFGPDAFRSFPEQVVWKEAIGNIGVELRLILSDQILALTHPRCSPDASAGGRGDMCQPEPTNVESESLCRQPIPLWPINASLPPTWCLRI